MAFPYSWHLLASAAAWLNLVQAQPQASCELVGVVAQLRLAYTLAWILLVPVCYRLAQLAQHLTWPK